MTATYTYAPSLGEISLYAFNLCGVRNTSLTAEHMATLKTAVNMMLSRWSNQGVNLWKVSLVTTTLTSGVATYSVDPSVIMVLDAYVSTLSGGNYTDRVIAPISRTEYSTYPNKTQAGFPTVFWFDRLINPTITLWPVPDGTGNPVTVSYYCVTQVGDATLPSGATPDIPYRWYDAFANGLAYYLSRIWAPTMSPSLKADAEESYMIASLQDEENVMMYISPMTSGYFRQ